MPEHLIVYIIKLINLIIPIQIISGVVAIIISLFDPKLSYAVVSITLVILIFTWLWGKAIPKPEPIPELSDMANTMRRKFRAYYISPNDGQKCSCAESGLMLSLIPITIIACINNFWWSIAISGIIFIVTGPLQRTSNPTNFMSPIEKLAHNEILQVQTHV